MPIPIVLEAISKGNEALQYIYPVLKVLPWLALVAVLKIWFGGARNRTERVMHGKVVMITGGTSGVGAAVARQLADRGAQLVLLTQQAPTDPFLIDYVDDLRAMSNNELIYAEQVDLASLHSVRSFATKWIDNTPPRRLDMVILCASTLTPRWASDAKRARTVDGTEPCWGVNCLAPAHLLTLLSPALRAQPPDRDVRIVVASCSGSAVRAGNLAQLKDSTSPLPAANEFASSALARIILARAFQRQLDASERSDKQPNNVRVVLVDPGRSRTPGMRRWLSGGSLLGLVMYLLTWPVWWLVLKSAEQGAQSILYACMEASLGQGPGGRFVRECMEMRGPREAETGDAKIGTTLWTFAERQITALEKQSAVKRAAAKKEAEEKARRARTEVAPGTAGPNTVAAAEAAGKVLGEVIDDDDGEVLAATGAGARKAGSRRSRKAA